MRKVLIVIALFVTLFAYAENVPFIVTSTNESLVVKEEQYDLDALIFINGIDASTQITYTGAESNYEWRYQYNGSTFSSNLQSIDPEANTLYTFYVNSEARYYIYVIDYSQVSDFVNSIEVVVDDNLVCDFISIRADGDFAELTYVDKKGETKPLPRKYVIQYEDTQWNEKAWEDVDMRVEIAKPYSITIEAPKKTTTFDFFGDEFALQMGLKMDTVSVSYTAVSIEGHLKGQVIERKYMNEKDRSTNKSENSNLCSGSAPLVVEFYPNVNPLDFVYYEWIVYDAATPNRYSRYNDDVLRYTFEDSGDYVVKLKATTNTCTYIDSVDIQALESFLDVPNAFTPNGDGINDEFRVVYKSIDRFEMVVQNRWGRTVFKTNNPGVGWDGTINGRPAAEGTYYYIIIAYGTDVYKENLNIGKLRNRHKAGEQVRYRLSGSVSLLRNYHPQKNSKK